jgi:hypothetical protein
MLFIHGENLVHHDTTHGRHNTMVRLTVLTQYHQPHPEPLEHSLCR